MDDSLKKATSSACQSAPRSRPPRRPHTSVGSSASCVFPFGDTLIPNRCVPKGWFNKINNSYPLIKDILKRNWLFCSAPLLAAKGPVTARPSGPPPRLLWGTLRGGCCTDRAAPRTGDKARVFQHYPENSLLLAIPRRRLRTADPALRNSGCGLCPVLRSWKAFWESPEAGLPRGAGSLSMGVSGCLLKMLRPGTKLPALEPLWEGLRNLSSKVS